MAPKKRNDATDNKKRGGCAFSGPGPQYKLKTLVGYNDHCPSKVRNPAYSIPGKCEFRPKTFGPGPKYMLPSPKLPGMSMGWRPRDVKKFITPGPYLVKYPLCPKCPGFTMKFRKKCKVLVTPGPTLPATSTLGGPQFTIGRRPCAKVITTPGPYDVKVTLTKPRIPEFSIPKAVPALRKYITPGPTYLPPPHVPKFAYGIRHSECILPVITECEEEC